MRRIAATLAVLAVAAGFVVLASGAGQGEPNGHLYWVEMDNAFGLIKGGDMKVAGVRAGKIYQIKLDTKTNLALVGFRIKQAGFGSLRTDVHCESRPQSLIGEYYLECEPGTSKQLLSNNTEKNPIPVTQTASTIAPDIVQDVFREPQRQRFSIILGELGAGVAGNGQNLADTLHRAVPALANTDAVLSILAAQNRTLADLATQADTVLHDLSNNRSDVQRWVVSAGNAARDTAAEKAALAQGLAELPGFLAQLKPTMASLGRVAVNMTPALQNLDASSGQLKNLFNNLGPFANASTPSFAALGRASVTGNQAVVAAKPTIAQLATFARGAPELAQNLSIVLQHLDNPAYGADRDPRAVPQHPVTHSNTYTGLEALLQYVFDQANNTNGFSHDGHQLALATIVDPTTCSPYADAAAARKYPQCRSWLGPTQPGVTTPDPTTMVAKASRASAASHSASAARARATAAQRPTATSAAAAGQTCVVGICLPTSTPRTSVPSAASSLSAPSASSPAAGAGGPTVAGPSAGTPQPSQELLSYLLGP
jgi:phospholipid/cholesterol/gamma-HCH transport system substrate-binding protein